MQHLWWKWAQSRLILDQKRVQSHWSSTDVGQLIGQCLEDSVCCHSVSFLLRQQLLHSRFTIDFSWVGLGSLNNLGSGKASNVSVCWKEGWHHCFAGRMTRCITDEVVVLLTWEAHACSSFVHCLNLAKPVAASAFLHTTFTRTGFRLGDLLQTKPLQFNGVRVDIPDFIQVHLHPLSSLAVSLTLTLTMRWWFFSGIIVHSNDHCPVITIPSVSFSSSPFQTFFSRWYWPVENLVRIHRNNWSGFVLHTGADQCHHCPSQLVPQTIDWLWPAVFLIVSSIFSDHCQKTCHIQKTCRLKVWHHMVVRFHIIPRWFQRGPDSTMGVPWQAIFQIAYSWGIKHQRTAILQVGMPPLTLMQKEQTTVGHALQVGQSKVSFVSSFGHLQHVEEHKYQTPCCHCAGIQQVQPSGTHDWHMFPSIELACDDYISYTLNF